MIEGLLLMTYSGHVNTNKMCAVDTRHEKNEILVETGASVLYGALCSIVLFKNPMA